MKKLVLSQDKYKMNWIEGKTEWGTVKCTLPLAVETKSKKNGDVVKEEYIFTNNTDSDIFTSLEDIGIYTPFNDEYTTAEECMTKKCHTHIWCGGEVSYVMALRMGGEAPHLGLILNKGSLGGYSVDREPERMSNDRGDFILHPSPFSLAPGESYIISWSLFPYNDKDDFFEKAMVYCDTFLYVESDKYIMFEGEMSEVTIKTGFAVSEENIKITLNESDIPFTFSDNIICFKSEAVTVGEQTYKICVNGIHTHLRLMVKTVFHKLLKSRCRFITEKQQYINKSSALDGAYLIYDNEQNSLFYSRQYDYNGGRERVGMGILLASYLQQERDADIEKSLKKYIAYVKRELVNEETGEVYNDYRRDNSYKRLYNAPWFALLYTEFYKLYNDKSYLTTAYKILLHYYANGGENFYAIELPMKEIIECMKTENMKDETDTLVGLFICHADRILQTGTSYPASEVNYEQSIVAPAADILLKAYSLTGDKKYLNGAKKQIDVLELFNGLQPDYHLYEVAIRHWDGYWFGKSRMYGDTFPHYWSALSGNVYYDYAVITDDEKYLKKAKASLRGVMSMFMPDGSASCAYIYPITVNGEKGNYFDSYANDQDWGLYYMLRYTSKYSICGDSSI